MPLLVAVEVAVALEVLVRGEQETTRAAGRIDDDLSGLRLHAVDDGLDDPPGREVLPRAPLDVLRVPLEQPLVGVALHVGGHRRPVFPADQLDDQPAQFGGVLDAVLRLLEDQPEHAALRAQDA